MFRATVWHTDTDLGIVFFQWPEPTREVMNGNPVMLWHKHDFKVIVSGYAEIRNQDNDKGLYLPGSGDGRETGPIVYKIMFLNRNKIARWIEPYKKAYRELNGCEPKIINLMEDQEEFTMETVG